MIIAQEKLLNVYVRKLHKLVLDHFLGFRDLGGEEGNASISKVSVNEQSC